MINCESILQHIVIDGFNLQTIPAKTAIKDEIIFFIGTNSNYFYFDMKKKILTELPPQDKSIQGAPNCLTIAPNHGFAAACFNDGSIQVWCLSSMTTKVSNKFMNAKATSCLFIQDNTLILSSADRQVSLAKISKTPIGITIKEVQLGQDRSLVRSFSKPPVFQHTDGIPANPNDSSKLIAPDFSNIAGILYFDRFIFANITSSINQIAEFPCSKGAIGFGLTNPELLSFAIATSSSLTVYSYSKGSEAPEKIYSTCLPGKQPMDVSYLSDSIISIINEDRSCTIVYIKENKVTTAKIDYKGSIAVDSRNFSVIEKDKIHNFYLVTFDDELSRSSGDIETAISLARRAMKNDTSIIGLPINSNHKSLYIKNAISPLLLDEAKRLVSSNGSAAALAFLKPICDEFDLYNQIIANALPIFKESDSLNDFFQWVISTDPTGTKFDYSKEFVQQLVDNSKTDISKFLLGLPAKSADASLLMKYATPRKHYNMIAAIFMSRLRDPASAMLVYEQLHEWDRIFEVFDIRWHRHEYITILEWLFTPKDGKFIRLEMLYNESAELLVDVLSNASSFISKEKRPMKIDSFLTFFSILLQSIKVNSTTAIYKLFEDICLKQEKISGAVVKYLSAKTFSGLFAEPDHRDECASLIFASVGPSKALQLLCHKFGLTNSERSIRIALGDYRPIVEEIVARGGDVFEYIRQHVEVIEPSMTILAMVDPVQLARLVPTTKAVQYARQIEHNEVKNNFLMTAFIIGMDLHELSADEQVDLMQFMALHDEDSALKFARKFCSPENAKAIIPIFEKAGLFEICLLCADLIGDYDLALKYMASVWNKLPAIKTLQQWAKRGVLTPQISEHSFEMCLASKLEKLGYTMDMKKLINEYIQPAIECFGVAQAITAMVQGLSGVKKELLTAAVEPYVKYHEIEADGSKDWGNVCISCAGCGEMLFNGQDSVVCLTCGHCIHKKCRVCKVCNPE